MNNKDKIFLASLQETLKEFVKGDIGAAARADLKALEKGTGGKKRLDQADKILAEAEAHYAERIADGDREVNKLMSVAAAEIKTARAALDLEKSQLDSGVAQLDKQRGDLSKRQQKFDETATALGDREETAAEYEDVVKSRENAVAVREANATQREAEIKRFDDWRAAAPA